MTVEDKVRAIGQARQELENALTSIFEAGKAVASININFTIYHFFEIRNLIRVEISKLNELEKNVRTNV